jgi:hypothetical protein
MKHHRYKTDTPKRGYRTGHEERDANIRWIFGLVILLLLSALAIQTILAGYLHKLKNGPQPTDAWRPAQHVAQTAPTNAPFPRLQVSPPLDLQAFRSREESELNTYGWIDRTAGVVRVPIERAMDLVLTEGLPTRSGTNENKSGPSAYELIRQLSQQRK